MNKIELAIIQTVAEMDETQQQQALELLQALSTSNKPSLATWLSQLESFREQIQAQYGSLPYNSVDLLHETHEGV